MATPNTSGSGAGTSMSDQQILSLLAGAGGGAGQPASAIVPLWLTRASNSAPPAKTRPGRSGEIDYEIASARSDFRATPTTQDAAEQYWMDMPDEERRAFTQKAIKAGMWEPKDGPGGLFRAWAQAVGFAASYNGAHPGEKDKWLSPWEAVDKLYAAGYAGSNGAIDGIGKGNKPFTGWRTNKYNQVSTFTDQQIKQTAEKVLQQELGRDPTKAEVAAYTIAANKAAAENPQMVTERTRDTAWDEAGRPIDSETQRVTQGDSFDPSQTIQDMARGTQEHKNVKAATDYFSAAMQALGSIV